MGVAVSPPEIVVALRWENVCKTSGYWVGRVPSETNFVFQKSHGNGRISRHLCSSRSLPFPLEEIKSTLPPTCPWILAGPGKCQTNSCGREMLCDIWGQVIKGRMSFLWHCLLMCIWHSKLLCQKPIHPKVNPSCMLERTWERPQWEMPRTPHSCSLYAFEPPQLNQEEPSRTTPTPTLSPAQIAKFWAK